MSSFFGGRTALSLGILSGALLSTGCHIILGYDDFTDQASGGSGAAGGGAPNTTTTTTGGDCTGCVDGQGTCQPGDTLVACGASGATCESCDDMSPCTLDACSPSGCTYENVEGVCPGGVCENGVCTPLEEDCTNGADDNGDGNVDCADPICTGVGYECIAPAPNGWSQPVAKNLVASIGNAQCLGAYPTQDSAGSFGLGFVDADCAPVTCGCVTNGACDSANLRVHENSNALLCDAGCMEQKQVFLSCTDLEPAVSASCSTNGPPILYFAGQATTGPFTGSCQSQVNGTPTLPPPMWQGAAAICSPASFGAGCGTGTCAPPAAAPLSSGLCVYQSGDVPCPGAPYTDKTVLFGGAQDERSCACSCITPPCGGTINLYEDTTCTGAVLGSRNVPQNGCLTSGLDTNDGTLGGVYLPSPDPLQTQCQGTPPIPTGQVNALNPTTICCEP